MSQTPSSPKGEKKDIEKFIDTGYPLPAFYGEDRLVILPRDPHWIFVYWEVTEGRKEQIRKEYGKDIFENVQTVLRVYDVTGIERFDGNNSLGYKDTTANIEVRNWYIKVEQSGRTYCVEIGLKTRDGRYIMILRSNIISLPAGLVSDLTDEQWILLQEDYDKLLRVSGVDKIGVGSLEMAKYLAKRWEMLQMVSSGAFSNISSLGKKHEENPRKFYLLADAELVIYGATEPTASLTVSDRMVKLNPDGTFSLRFAFPDGKQEFIIKSISGDRIDERKITITAERKTK